MKTKQEEDYHELVAGLGCVVCRNLNYGYSPANVHHIRTPAGMGQKAPHALVIPLCHEHHQGGQGIHSGQKSWESLYGTEWELLAQTILDAHKEKDR